MALLSEWIFLGWLLKSGEMMNIMARLRGADLREENIGMTAIVEATKEISLVFAKTSFDCQTLAVSLQAFSWTFLPNP